MQKSIIFFLLIFGQAMLAQKFNRFYVEPTVHQKIITNSKSDLPSQIVTEYFNITPKQNFYSPSINIGVNVGYTFKNNNRIQIGLSQDESLQAFDSYGISVTGSPYNNVYQYGQTQYSEYTGVAYTNFSLLFKKNVLFIQSKAFNADRYIHVSLNIGLSYVYIPNGPVAFSNVTSGISYKAPDSSLVSIITKETRAPQPFKRALKLNTGIDFTFGKKDKELFSLNISFMTNLDKTTFYSYSLVQGTVTKNGTTKSYNAYIEGKGNGLYFTLSKRIYPFMIYNNRQIKKMEKFKT